MDRLVPAAALLFAAVASAAAIGAPAPARPGKAAAAKAASPARASSAAVSAVDETAPVTQAGIEKAVAAIADYDLGKGVEPLREVERIVRRTVGQADLRLDLDRQLARLLESQASYECKWFVCEQLSTLGTDESLPALARMLTDEKMAHIACCAIGTNPSAKAAATLRDALAGAKGKALVCIVNLLGDRRDGESAGAIGKLVTGDDPAVAEAAFSALGKISGPEAAKVLARYRTAGGGKMGAAVTAAYLQCAEGLAAQGKRDEAVAIYKEVLAPGELTLYRRGALAALMAMGGPEVVPLVISTIGGDDQVMKATAIANIRTLRGAGVAERFAAELPKLRDPLQVLLIDALADRGDAAVRPAIAAAAGSASEEVRVAALKALGQVGDASSVAMLARAAAERKSDEEKRAGLQALRVLRADGADAAIAASLKSAAGPARAELIQVLSDRGAAAIAVPVLLREAESPDDAVRAAAMRGLGMLAGPGEFPAVVRLLVNLRGEAGRQEAEGAAVAVSRKIAAEGGGADAVLAAFRSAAPAAKGSLVRVLRGIGGQNAFEAARAALKDGDPQVQDAAVRAMADWPDARALPVVLDVFRSAQNEAHRALALRGAVRLLGLGGRLPEERLKAYAELMNQARGPAEKKLVLAGLANVADPAALALVEPCFGDASVGAEAAVAALGIARNIMGANGDEAKAAMARLAAASKDAAVRQQAEEIVRRVDKLGGYIVAWQVSGPYLQAGKNYLKLFDVAFLPEQPEAKGVVWRPLPVETEGASPTVLDLAAAVGGTECVAYVRTWVHSAAARPARVELGADDGLKVWLNGQVVLADNRAGACAAGSEKADVTLREGWNSLVMKVTQNMGPWAFCARLAARDGSKIEGIRIDPMHGSE